MIDIKMALSIAVAVLTIGGAIVTFFQLQTKQNMRIKELEKDLTELRRKQSLNTSNQIATEKNLIEQYSKLDLVMKSLEELEKGRGK